MGSQLNNRAMRSSGCHKGVFRRSLGLDRRPARLSSPLSLSRIRVCCMPWCLNRARAFQILSKCDLIDKTVMERYLAPAGADLVSELHRTMGARFRNLNEALARIVRCWIRLCVLAGCGLGRPCLTDYYCRSALLVPFRTQLDEYSMVAFVPLDITDEDSLDYVLAQVDHAIQYGKTASGRRGRWLGTLAAFISMVYRRCSSPVKSS